MFITLFRMRILPATMFAVFMLLAVKLADVARGGHEFARLFFIASVRAQDPEAAKAEPPAPPEAPAAPEAAAHPETPPSPEAAKDPGKVALPAAPPPEAAKVGPAAPVVGPAETAPTEAVPPGGGRGLSLNSRVFSPTELDILQSLVKRREQLDGWEKDVSVKENLLADVEKRVDEKITQIEAMKAELRAMISQYDNEQDSKIKSLVKIYEAMKPRDAARIFDEVEMPILLLVIDRMAEKKAAPILAAMEPKKAKQLTVELAETRRLQNQKVNGGKAAATPPPTPAPKP